MLSRCAKCLDSVEEVIRTPSKYRKGKSKFHSIKWINLWKVCVAIHTPKTIRVNSKSPKGVQIVAFGIS